MFKSFVRWASTHKVITSDVVEETLLHPRLKTVFQKNVGPTLTPVQFKCIDEFIESPNGIVVRAKTGTGKTYAFGIPIINSVLNAENRGNYVDSVVFAPTRDLALQTQLSLEKVLVDCLPSSLNHETVRENNRGKYGKNSRNNRYGKSRDELKKSLIPLVIGQTSYHGILAHFKPGNVSPLVVASPGRFMDMLRNQPSFRNKFTHLQNIVIDEADELLNGNFKQDIKDIIKELTELREPQEGEAADVRPKTMLFSATINEDVFELAESAIGQDFPFVDVTGSKTEEVNTNITQKLVKTSSLANSYIGAVERLVSKCQDEPRFKAIVFLSTTSAVEFFSTLMSRALAVNKIKTPVYSFHGKLTQGRRDNAQNRFRQAKNGILVASGIGARGMDFPNVSHVVQIGVSSEIDQHTHKIGRTGRNGEKGDAILFANQYEMPFVKALEKNNNTFEVEELNEEEPEFLEMTKCVEEITQRLGREYIHDTIYGFLGNYRNVPPKVAKFNMTALARDNAIMFNRFAGEPKDELDEPLKLGMSYRNAQEMHIDFDAVEDVIEFTGAKPRSQRSRQGGNNNTRGGRGFKRENSWNDGNRGSNNNDRGGYRSRGGNDRNSHDRGSNDRGGYRRNNDRRDDKGGERYSRW